MIQNIKKIFFFNINSDIEKSLYSKLSIILFILLGVFLFQEIAVHFYETFVTGRPHNTKLGDWVINYNDGFVRRGLVGQILLYLDWYLFVPLILSSFIFTTLVIIFFYYFLFKIFTNLKDKKIFWLLLFLSPAFLLFTYYDFEGGFRKENLGFLSYAILIYSFVHKNNTIYIVTSLLIYFVAVFSHEMNSFFIPFYLLSIFFLYKKNMINKNILIILYFLYFLISVSSIIISFYFSGFGHSPGICETVTNTGIHNNICGGSIFALEKDIHFYIEKTLLHFPNYPIYYIPLLILSIIPIFLTKFSYSKLIFILISFTFILPLFVIAADWGRWISIYSTYTYLALMMLNLNYNLHFKKINFLVAFIYIFSWYIPVYDIDQNTISLFSNFKYIFNPITFINNPPEYKFIFDILAHDLKYLFQFIPF